MAYVNMHLKQIELKIVYYGMGQAGKTTNLMHLHAGLNDDHRGKMVSLATESESTIFFDFFPVELGSVQGMKVKLRMYTVPGQDYYEASRRLILDGADGVVMVIDSAPALLKPNIAAWEDLTRNLAHYRLGVDRVPVVFQYNKRDLPGALAVGTVEKAVGFKPLTTFEAVASKGEGVRATARAISRAVVERFNY